MPKPGAWALSLGVDGARISATVDVTRFLESKRRALQAHATQFPDSSFLWSIPGPAFDLLFGTEYFIVAGGSGRGDWLLGGEEAAADGHALVQQRLAVREVGEGHPGRAGTRYDDHPLS